MAMKILKVFRPLFAQFTIKGECMQVVKLIDTLISIKKLEQNI
jgi:hypothetical protein